MTFPYNQNPSQYSPSYPNDIPVHFRTQYANYVRDDAQQRQSLLRGLFEETTISGEKIVYEFSGAAEMNEVTERYGNTFFTEANESRRECSLTRFNLAFLIDKDFDAVKLIEDPQGVFVRKSSMALGRRWDRTILAAAFAPVAVGHTGGSFVAWSSENPDCSIITSTQTSGLTLEAVIEAATILDENEWMNPGEARYAIVPPRAIGSLLNTTQVTSADYNSVKTLVQGEVDTFMGFRFIKSNLVPKTSDNQYYRCIFCSKSAIAVAGKAVKTKIAEVATKQFKTAIYTECELGAIRCFETAIVEIQVPVLPLGDMELS